MLGDERHKSPVEQSVSVGTTVHMGRDEAAARAAAAVDVVAEAYDAHQRELYSFALRTARDAGAAEDAVQDAFLRLARETQSGWTPDNVRAWLFRVIANGVISRGRRIAVAGRFRHLLVNRDVAAEPSEPVLRRERTVALEAELSKLKPDARVALLMAAQGFSIREIGVAVGRSEGATRAMLCRARLTLRERLQRSGVVDGRA
jgi:RNA polymerase sigma-70 factor (ECF subfamily)